MTTEKREHVLSLARRTEILAAGILDIGVMVCLSGLGNATLFVNDQASLVAAFVDVLTDTCRCRSEIAPALKSAAGQLAAAVTDLANVATLPAAKAAHPETAAQNVIQAYETFVGQWRAFIRSRVGEPYTLDDRHTDWIERITASLPESVRQARERN